MLVCIYFPDNLKLFFKFFIINNYKKDRLLIGGRALIRKTTVTKFELEWMKRDCTRAGSKGVGRERG